jgi:NAD-dependent deacetylase
MDTRNIEPNDAHRYLVELEKRGKLSAIVTQNIDGLHQKAGSKKVFEIHGSALRNYCMKCGKRYDANYIFDSKEEIPHCTCGGIIRPDITLYEEALPEEAVNGAIKAIREADLLIIGGTSLTVYPAASYINYFRGKYLVVINESDLSIPRSENTLILHEKIGKVFRQLSNYDGQ